MFTLFVVLVLALVCDEYSRHVFQNEEKVIPSAF